MIRFICIRNTRKEPTLKRNAAFHLFVFASVILWSGCVTGPGTEQPGPGVSQTDPAIDRCFTLVDTGNYQEALGICEEASASNPGSFIALAAYAEALRETGNPELAEVYYRKALAIDPTALHTRMELGGLLQERGDGDAALTEYQAALDRQPDYLPAIIETARIHQALRHWESAADSYRKAIAIQPSDQQLRMELVQVLVSAGRFPDVGKVIADASTDFPESAGMQLTFGTILQEQKRYRDAIACFLTAVKLDPGNSMARYNLALSYFSNGQIPEARKALARFLSGKPDSSGGHFLAGQLAMQDNDHDQAEASFKKAIQYDSRNGAAYVMLGNLMQQRGDRDGAKEAYRQALRINPNDPVAKRNLKRLY